METIITTNHQVVSSETKNFLFSEKFWETVEFNRLGISAMLLLFTVCFGGIAAGFGMDGSGTQLAMVVFPTVFSLTMVLGGAPMHIVFGVCSISVIIDFLVLLF